jgi:hypothetical protein
MLMVPLATAAAMVAAVVGITEAAGAMVVRAMVVAAVEMAATATAMAVTAVEGAKSFNS